MSGSQAVGERSWFDLPSSARTGIERRLGGAVSAFDPAAGGFSDGVLGLVTTVAGGVFIKAVPSDSSSAVDYRTEAAVSQILPSGVPTPRLRFTFEEHGWHLMFRCGGRPASRGALDGRSAQCGPANAARMWKCAVVRRSARAADRGPPDAG